MIRKFTLITICLAGIIFFGTVSYGQTATPIVVDNVMKVAPRHPEKPSDKYITNGKSKKKIKTKIRQVQGWECPSYLHYESKPQKMRQKMIKKRRRKL